MVIFSHPTGNANVRHAALGLHRAQLLGEFWTTVHHRPDGALHRLLPTQLGTQLARRAYPVELHDSIRTQPLRELLRMISGRLGFKSLTRHETGPLSVDAIYRALDLKVSKRLKNNHFQAVYAYEDGASRSFEEAKKRGLTCIYDLPIGHWKAARRIMTEEALRNPAWAMTIPGNLDSVEKTARKDQELQAANLILVASTFTKKTLLETETPHRHVHVIPYGAPTTPSMRIPRLRNPDTPLKVLYVGALSQRKGLSYLFEAKRLSGSAITLTVVGQAPENRCAALDRELSKINWIPSCPHAEILRLMSEHDVFVFPSLFEGFGLVLLEAMAMGMPIITTAHTAGPDLISSEGVEGFIVPVQSGDAIAEKLLLLYKDRALLAAMSEAARQRAAHFSWDTYETTLARTVAEAIEGTSRY